MTLVVASLVERGIAGVTRSSKKAFAAGADLVEVRLDHIRGLERKTKLLEDARSAVDGPAIATLRSAREGGLSRCTGASRARLLATVLDSGFEYVDLELVADRKLLESRSGVSSGPKMIGSYHFRRPATRSEIRKQLERACEAADIGKVAAPCGHASHAVAIADIGLEFSKKKRGFAVMGMGIQGQLTRARANGIGSELVYASLPGSPAAPGQLDIALQSNLLRRGAVVLGLIGHPVTHSISKPMQEAALRSAGLKGMYIPLDVPPGGMSRGAVTTLFEIGFSGLNVTIPHKKKAFDICDAHRPSATSTGAVNTLRWTKGKLVGENTDVHGLITLIDAKKVCTKGVDSLVIGAGGAARAACRVLLDGGSGVTVATRRDGRARALARYCGVKTEPFSSASAGTNNYGIVVNATPVGTRGTRLEGVNIPEGMLEGKPVFIDLVYNPPVTKSMKLARDRGCIAHGGLEMLVGQGAESFRIWTGCTPDPSVMRTAARRALI
ncbi:MAG: shikimate dehydrogenase [Candidatus Thermoplasmatota archaeon]|nr:shikimate dehydrogenase [Candidatus Thermoplasmatota archaeon]